MDEDIKRALLRAHNEKHGIVPRKYSAEALKEIQALEAEIRSLRKQIKFERCEYQKEGCLIVAELDEEGHCKKCFASMCRDWPEDCVYMHGPQSWRSKHDD